MTLCAVCRYLRLHPAETNGSVGLLTSIPELVAAAEYELDSNEDGTHIMLAVCAEHVVAIYRGRIAGVRMAWRLSPVPVSLIR